MFHIKAWQDGGPQLKISRVWDNLNLKTLVKAAAVKKVGGKIQPLCCVNPHATSLQDPCSVPIKQSFRMPPTRLTEVLGVYPSTSVRLVLSWRDHTEGI